MIKTHLELIHPNVRSPGSIMVYNFGCSAGESIGSLLTEDVSDPGARVDFKHATALPVITRIKVANICNLPNSERNFQILSSPNLLTFVVGSNI